MTAAARATVADAAYHAAIRRPHAVGALHLLLGLVHTPDSIGGSVLSDSLVSDVTVWSAIDYWELPSGSKFASPRLLAVRRGPKWRPSSRTVVSSAMRVAGERGSDRIDTGDLLMALVTMPNSRAAKVLSRNQLGIDEIARRVGEARGTIDEGPGDAPIPDLSLHRPVPWQEGADKRPS